MEVSRLISPISIASISLVLVALTTIPSIVNFAWRVLHPSTLRRPDCPYEDEDGVATEESIAAFSDSVPRYALLLGCLVGIITSLATAIAVMQSSESHAIALWLLSSTWVFIAWQSSVIFGEKNSPRKQMLGLYESLAALLVGIDIILLGFFMEPIVAQNRLWMALICGQLAAALLQVICGICLPRRPDVYWKGRTMDRECTTSKISRHSFAWAGHVLSMVKDKRNITVQDLPVLKASMRAEFLFKDFQCQKPMVRLWRTLYAAHYKKFLIQWVLVIIVCFTQILPQFFLLQILSALEMRQDDHPSRQPLWVWAVGLGSSIAINSWVENSLNWLSLANIGLATYEQLSALIVWKGMRCKDIKDNRDKTLDKTSQLQNVSMAGEQVNTQKHGRESTQTQSLKQSSINLLAVDAQRVSDFASTNYQFVSCFLKLIVSFTFLAKLVGPASLAVGLGGFFLSAPVNAICTKKYSQSQSRLMKIRDLKLSTVTEALLGIRQIKFSALEEQWYRKIKSKRDEELTAQWTNFVFKTGLEFVWIFSPIMLSAMTLGSFAFLRGDLTASVAFTTISIFNNVESTLGLLPELMAKLLNAQVSARRVEDYLNLEELDNRVQEGQNIIFEEATVRWPTKNPDGNTFALRDISLQFPKDELSLISGKVGTGKSLLLASILGETDIVAGSVTAPCPLEHDERFNEHATPNSWIIDSAFAYVAQIPWIQNATIRDNILSGLPYLEDRYHDVMHVCALEKDMELLQFGDQTDIGANGINLSGGQKWRLAFARALYSRAGILILDDIFSALDANVGKFIYDNGLTGHLGQGRTRILVTHHLSLGLPQAKYCVILSNGTVQSAGFKDELLDQGCLTEYVQEGDSGDSPATDTLFKANGVTSVSKQSGILSRRPSGDVYNGNGNIDVNSAPARFMSEEEREIGVTKWWVYGYYIKATSILSFTLVILFFISFVGINFARTWWISVWTRFSEESRKSRLFHTYTVFNYEVSPALQTTMSPSRFTVADDLWFYLGVYIGLSGLACFLGTIRYFFVFQGSMKASRVMFERLTLVILRMPLRWLDTVPVGRILNRLTADFNVVDSRLSDSYAYVIFNLLVMISTVAAGICVSYYVAIFVIALLSASLYFGQRYIIGAREVKRLESITKSPIYEQFGSVLTGISTVRAYRMSNTYIKEIHAKITDWACTYWHLWLFSRWLNLRLNMLGTMFSTLTAAIVITIPGIDAPLAGFCLSFVLQFSQTIIWAVRDSANLEIAMNSVERIAEYCQLVPEEQSGLTPPAAWPTEGRLDVSNLIVSYAPNLDPVLKGLTFSVKSGERIGVIGRTGAGKSSLTLALFRFLEAQQGSIIIDGIDISGIKLHDLRSRVAIIPQDPVLFSGSVRSNLDPFNERSDTELNDALERVHFLQENDQGHSDAPHDSAIRFNHLQLPVSQGGLNLSQGQRQLLCLARAIVSRPKIMVLDEATSAIDKATDQLVQQSIREEFQDSTLLVIAHRLSTVADFDRILVLDEGQVVEYDSPEKLMNREGVFRAMVENSHEKEAIVTAIQERKR